MSNVEIVTSIADLLLSPPAPSLVTRKYYISCALAASQIGVISTKDGSTANITRSIRNSFFDRIDAIDTMRVSALSSGYVLPDDPIPQINALNAGRKRFDDIRIDEALATRYVSSLRELSKILDAVADGAIDLSTKAGGTGQISSFEMSVDGIVDSTTGDALADIIGYQPDADLLARKQAIDALSSLDFRKRNPRLIAVIEPPSDNMRKIIVWAKMHDAAGYKLIRRNVFTGEVKESTHLASSVSSQDDRSVIEALSFYDDIDVSSVVSIIDSDLESDMLYAYSVVGLQRSSGGARKTYDVPFSPLFVSRNQIAQIEGITKVAQVSPYNAISKVIYGDERYDWILAAMNFLASRSRGDSDQTVRDSSFLGATFDSIIGLLSNGKLVAPDVITDVVSAVEASILSYGTTQTIIDVLDATGTTLFISSDDKSFHDVGAEIASETSGVGLILSSIDPMTATIDPNKLMATLFSKGGLPVPTTRTQTQGKSQQVTYQPVESISDVVGDDIIDVTTFSGISSMMKIIRVYHDRSGQRF